jgi:uncharacterized membrane protein YtjA (UPF0391 family)
VRKAGALLRSKALQLLALSNIMLKYAWIFLTIAIIAAIFGFSDVALATAEIAQALFYLFMVLFIASLTLGKRSVWPAPEDRFIAK